LSSVVISFAAQFRFDITPAESQSLADSIQDWEPFADTVPALQRLHSRFKLAILSNIDDDLFAYTAPKLRVPLEDVVTAQQAGGYKPSIHNFEMLLERLGIDRERLLHVAESLYHDVVPARSLGIATVWVNRRPGREASATKRVEAQPDLEVRDMAELATTAGC
jgi:2-haloacid dehalogenase